MKKYYGTELCGEFNGGKKPLVEINEYYLLKEGWILCSLYRGSLYRDNPNDLFYNTLNRDIYCLKRTVDRDKEMFDSLEDARDYLEEKIMRSYAEEKDKLYLAYSKALKEVKKI